MKFNNNSRRPLRILIWTLSIVLAAAALFAVAAGIEYYRLNANPPETQVVSEPQFIPSGDVRLGEKVICRSVFSAPWNASPDTVSVTPGEGTQILAEPVYRRVSYSWGRTKWALDISMQAYSVGETSPGTLSFSFRTSSGEIQMFELAIPALKVAEPEVADGMDLDVAGAREIEPPGKSLYRIAAWIAGVLILIAAVFFLVRFFRRKAEEKRKTFWELALDAIAELRKRVGSGRESSEEGIAELTDIVRHYLELRFELRAERQTTVEFLRELNRADSPLEDRDRKFLREFMEAADMVKFARLPAGGDVFENTAFRAGSLISGTLPAEDAVRGGDKK